MTWRPTPTSAALGRVWSGGTSISRSSVAAARQARRQPPFSSSMVKARGSTLSIGTEPLRTRTLHFLHVPWPPQVESIAIPFHDAASNTVVPAGTRTSPPSGRNCSRTLPVPAAAAASLIRHPWSANERGGVWGTGRFPTGSEEGGPVGETWFPPRTRAEGERCSCRSGCLGRRQLGPVGRDPACAPLVVAEQEVGRAHRLDADGRAGVHDRARQAVAGRDAQEPGAEHVPAGQAERRVRGAARHVHAQVVADQPHGLDEERDGARLGADR